MLSGHLWWLNGNAGNRGTYSYFWSSTPRSYTHSRYLYFYSTTVDPKANYNKPYGFTLHCVARFLCTFSSRALRSLPLSVMMSGDLHWDDNLVYGRGLAGDFWSSTLTSYPLSRLLYFNSTRVGPTNNYYKPHGYALRCVACLKPHPCFISIEFRNFHLRSKFLFSLRFFFQSSPQPSSFGYVVGLSLLGQWWSLR